MKKLIKNVISNRDLRSMANCETRSRLTGCWVMSVVHFHGWLRVQQSLIRWPENGGTESEASRVTGVILPCPAGVRTKPSDYSTYLSRVATTAIPIRYHRDGSQILSEKIVRPSQACAAPIRKQRSRYTNSGIPPVNIHGSPKNRQQTGKYQPVIHHQRRTQHTASGDFSR